MCGRNATILCKLNRRPNYWVDHVPAHETLNNMHSDVDTVISYLLGPGCGIFAFIIHNWSSYYLCRDRGDCGVVGGRVNSLHCSIESITIVFTQVFYLL